MRWKKLGIIAGGGSLPIELAHYCQSHQHDFYMIRLAGMADEGCDEFPGMDCTIAEIGTIFRALREQECDGVVMGGNVQRPNFSTLKPDWRGAALLPKFVSTAMKGDGALLTAIVSEFEAEGFLVIGADEVLDHVTPPPGALGDYEPDQKDLLDIKKAAAIVRALGPYDVGQGAVVSDGQVLGIEAAEGTDDLLLRCAHLLHRLSITPPRGVLVKLPKPDQELRVDLPTIGVKTIINASHAGLRGVALLVDKALILNRSEMLAVAREKKLFVYGFTLKELDALDGRSAGFGMNENA